MSITIPLGILRVWGVAKPLIVSQAGQYAEKKVTEGDMNIRDMKWDRLNREERKSRREAGEAWWQKSARQERRGARQDFWGRVLKSEEPPAPSVPPGLGSRLPSPGMPGSRTTGSFNGNGNGNGNGAVIPPWVFIVGAGGIAWFLLKKKK